MSQENKEKSHLATNGYINEHIVKYINGYKLYK